MTGGVAGATDWAMDTAALVAFPTTGAAALAEGAGRGVAFLADAALAGATLAATCLAGAFGATVLVTGLGAAALAGAFAAGFTAACAGAFADDLTGDLASAFAEPLAEAGAATLAAFVALTTGDDGAAALVLGVTVFTADADARAEAPLGVGLPDFAAVGAGAFTTGLLSGDDEAGTAGGAVASCLPKTWRPWGRRADDGAVIPPFGDTSGGRAHSPGVAWGACQLGPRL